MYRGGVGCIEGVWEDESCFVITNLFTVTKRNNFLILFHLFLGL